MPKWYDDPKNIARLKELWNDPAVYTTPKIAELMTPYIGWTVTKNVIVGQINRRNPEDPIGWPRRPSPIIRRDKTACKPLETKKRSKTLPPLVSETVVAPDGAVMVVQRVPTPPASPLPPPAPVVSKIAASSDAPKQDMEAVRALRCEAQPKTGRRPSATCCWPIGEPCSKSFRFCDSMSIAGKPYCDEHAKIAYVTVKVRRVEARA